MARIAQAYGIPATRVTDSRDLSAIQGLLESPGPALCQVQLDTAQEFEPRLKSRQLPDGRMVSPNLEDMYPFLPPDELEQNLLIDQEAVP